MVTYVCKRCGFSTIIRKNYYVHLHKKRPCKALLSQVEICTLKLNLQKYIETGCKSYLDKGSILELGTPHGTEEIKQGNSHVNSTHSTHPTSNQLISENEKDHIFYKELQGKHDETHEKRPQIILIPQYVSDSSGTTETSTNKKVQWRCNYCHKVFTKKYNLNRVFV